MSKYRDRHETKKGRTHKTALAIILWYTTMWSWILLTDALSLAGSRFLGQAIGLAVLMINVSIAYVVVMRSWKYFTHLSHKLNPYVLIFALIPGFALVDFLVAWLPAAFWYGPQAQIDSILPIGSLSFLTLQTPLIYAARFVGFFGLAGFVWAIVFLLCNKHTRKFAYIPAGFLMCLSFTGWALYARTSGPSTTVRIMKEPQNNNVSTVSTKGEDLVLFSEYGVRSTPPHTQSDQFADVKMAKQPTYFVGSSKEYVEGRIGFQNRILLGEVKSGVVGYQDKYRLIPGGEDAPYIVRAGLLLTGNRAAMKYFDEKKAVVKGDKQLSPWDLGGGVKLGAAVCSSIIAPQDFRALTESGATILTNSASLSTFGGSQLFEWQQRSMGRFMAVANSRYFAQSAKGARAYAYDNNGRVLAEINQIDSSVVTLKNNKTKTVYTLFGEWLVWLGFCLGGVLVVAPRIWSCIIHRAHMGKK